MINRQGERVVYPDCEEIVPGVFIGDGDVYFHDAEGEIIAWVHDELVEDADAASAAFAMVALAAKQGISAVRRNRTDRGTTMAALVKSTKARQGFET